MGVKKAFFQAEAECPPIVIYRCDTDSEKPMTGLSTGDLCITLDNSRLYFATSPTAWAQQTNQGGGGGGIAWREFTLLADAAGVTKSNIGTAFVELAAAGLRSKVDLTGFTDCRIVAGVNKVGTGTQSWKIQYSTDQSSWIDLTPVVDDAAAAGERLNVSAWGTIPTGAKADVFIRCVGKSTVAGDDPVVKSVSLNVK